MNKKEIQVYYFSVEGETEKWYLEWLQKTINSYNYAKYHVRFNIKVEKNPKKRAKQLSMANVKEILHVFDFEDNNNEKNFKNTLIAMNEAAKIRRINYQLGYSNYTFELWIILHKMCFNSSLNHRNQYLKYINQLYHYNFESMAKYKDEKNFKNLLAQLSISDVKQAINNANKIMNNNHYNHHLQKYKNYEYYRENPSLNFHEYIQKIFEENEL